MLSSEDKKKLLEVASEAIRSYVESGKTPIFDISSPALLADGAAFVSLHKRGELRGCIGHVEARDALWSTVRDVAIAAATQDPRFPPVSKDELPLLHLEISVMTPLKRVKSVDEIKVGQHGLMMVRGFKSGLLLPQVATEYKWTREEFLQHTCIKAGLPPDTWKDPKTEIYSFEAEVFSKA
jgi:AmmeMemoRadiSam system protein A